MNRNDAAIDWLLQSNDPSVRYFTLAELLDALPRSREALDIIESKRGADGLWRAEAFYWKPISKARSNADGVDSGRRGPNEMITLNALRVLKAAGRIG